MTRQQSAAIPYREHPTEGLQVLLVTSKRHKRWVLPKGNIKRGLLPQASAAREAFEEGGVLGSIDHVPVGTYRQQKLADDGTVIELTVKAYALAVTTELNSWPEKALRQRRWARLGDVHSIIEDASLRGILAIFAAVFSPYVAD